MKLFSNKKLNFSLALDRSGILFIASLARKRYSVWQERLVLKIHKVSAPKKINTKENSEPLKTKKAPIFRLML
ncbi:hypothetical protein EAH81_03400 [Flavobacterium pectinovorum]|uniref:Uncharacterized protein n=1 Tax=Flavobacterium pectinovorum TaxID=29533 RepID=A0A502F2V3_9FLAO|nr:hypothetical protein EAH81_03400 [Flavobacterium pectinovorum]